jgi:serine/threonine protein kinase
MADRYKVYEQLGAGGVGTVFRAYDTQLKRWVAIKRLMITSEAREGGGDIQEELRQEADSLASLRHPNIVTIFDVANDEDGLFIVMELLEGEDLADVVARGPLPYDDFKELAYQTLEGLLAAHERHILHRDIKPENIKAERLPGGRMQAKIIDFGLARVGLKARKQTEDVSGTVMGSIHYMAPEQLTREPVDERTDLYSLGCVFYEALSGQKAFDGPTMADVIDKHIHHEVAPLHTIAPHVPPWLGAWVERLMAPRPDDRPASAQQAMEEFRAWERMPTMVPYMPWMAMPMSPDQAYPEQAYYAEAQPVEPDDEEVVAVAILDDEQPAARPVTGPTQTRRPSNPPSTSIRPGAASSRHPQSSASGQRHSDYTPKKSKLLPILATLIILAAGVSLFLKFRKNTSLASGGTSTSTTQTAGKALFDLPVDRLMPPLDDDRCLHLVADVGTFKSGQSSDGKPFPAYANDRVIEWHDVAPRGQDNPLQAFQRKPTFAPKRIAWPTSPSGPSVKGNRAALQFLSSPSAPLAMESLPGASNASAFPFGTEPIEGPKGATVAIVFQDSAEPQAAKLLTLQANAKHALTIRITPAKAIHVTVQSAGGTAELETQNINASQPTILIASWNGLTGKIEMFALNPPPEPGKPSKVFQQISNSAAPAPQAPLTQLLISSADTAPAEQFHGVIGELIVYACALTRDHRLFLGSSQLKSYYFK